MNKLSNIAAACLVGLSAGAAQAQDASLPYDAEKAAEAIYVPLSTKEGDLRDVATWLSESGCKVEKRFALQVPPQYGAFLPRGENVAPESSLWLAFDCNTGVAYSGVEEVAKAKVSEMQYKASLLGPDDPSPGEYGEIAPGGSNYIYDLVDADGKTIKLTLISPESVAAKQVPGPDGKGTGVDVSTKDGSNFKLVLIPHEEGLSLAVLSDKIPQGKRLGLELSPYSDQVVIGVADVLAGIKNLQPRPAEGPALEPTFPN